MSEVTVRPQYHLILGVAGIWISAGAAVFFALDGDLTLSGILAIVSLLVLVALVRGKSRRKLRYTLSELILPWALLLLVGGILIAVGTAYHTMRPYIAAYVLVLVVLLVLAGVEVKQGAARVRRTNRTSTEETSRRQ